MLSKRMDRLSPSLTLEITAKANELKEQGKNILSFSAGEPDFDTPNRIKEEAKLALDRGFTKYTAVSGVIPLKEAIVNKLQRDNNLKYQISDIVVSNGAKHSLFNLFQALINNGDEVIIPTPYWVTYPELVRYSGGVPIFIETNDISKFKITPEQLYQAITPKTKVLILTTPSNPTGSVYSKEELEDLARVVKDTNIFIVSDEIYEKLVYETKFVSTASINRDMFLRTITINGLSKSVAMTGWRFGYLASPNKELISAMNKLQGQSTSNINSITQGAAIVALNGSANDDIEAMRVEFEKRRDLAVKLMNEIDGLSVSTPDGAFYLFVNIKKVSNDSMLFAKELLEEVGVAIVPGVAFGLEGYFRLSFATSEDIIKDGISRIKKFVESKKSNA